MDALGGASVLEAKAMRAISKAGEVLSVDEARAVINELFAKATEGFERPHPIQVAAVISDFWQAITPAVGIRYVTIKIGFEQDFTKGESHG